MLSDLWSSGSVGRPASSAVTRTCTGDGKVEIYMFHTPGTYMPPTGFVVMAYGTHVHLLDVGFGEKKRLQPTSGTSFPDTDHEGSQFK